MTAIPIGIGVIAWVVVHRAGRGVPMRARLNVFEHLFERLEPSGLALLAAVAALLLLLARPAGRRVAKDDAPREGDVRSWERRRFAFFVAAVVLALSWLGREWVFFGVDLAMDEFASWFQARIFLEGCLRAPVPPSWARYVPALIPTFISFDPASAAWASSYLPVFALLRTAALAVGAEGALNPLLTAVAMPLIWTLCRRLWPGERDCAAVGTVLLGTSSQVLVNAMTGYAMPAHLTANLAWILLWLSPGRVPALALPLVGGLALGLHNPFPHALFVAPFLLASTRKWSVRRLVYTGVVYAAFTAGWWAWLRAFHPQATSSGGPLAIFSARDGARFCSRR